MKLMWKHTRPPVVESVQDQTAQAADLARIPGQDMLTDPRTNPAVRALLDHLRNEQHRMQLEAEHGRAKRRHRVDDRHRAEAELTLHAILQAKQASSPARSVLALHRGRTWFMGASLTASVSLSVGSAFGVGHLADELGAPKVTGWVAEVGMVGLSTITILYLAHLFRHGWVPSALHRLLLGFLAIGPLLGSVVANSFGAGPVGVACSVGAALFGVFSHLVSDNSAGALRKKADEVGMEDAQTLRATALGDDLFALPSGHSGDHTEPTPDLMATRASDHKPVTTPVPSPVATVVPTGEQKPSGHPELVTTDEHKTVTARVATREHSGEPTKAVVTPKPMATAQAVTTPAPATTKAAAPPKKPAKRRTRDQIRAELQTALKEHYDNGGGEPQVKPLADKLNVNRRIVRELLDEMNVRPMIRKAV